jgi:hypothetical protein
MTDDSLAWLADFQARFSSVLRAPLDPSSGQLQVRSASYDARLCAEVASRPGRSAAQAMAVYNRQYWVRLLRVMQQDVPLVAGLMGAWHFNQLALQFLREQPPRGHDLARIADGFEHFLERSALAWQPRLALLQAARIDAAFRRVFVAPDEPPFVPPSGDGAELHLKLSAAWTCVEERWSLLQLRRQLPDLGGAVVPLPPTLPTSRRWAVFREGHGTAQLSLAPEQARLFELLARLPLTEALATLESECAALERDALPKRVQGWLQQAVAKGFFVASR